VFAHGGLISIVTVETFNAFDAMIRRETAQWTKIIREQGIKVQ